MTVPLFAEPSQLLGGSQPRLRTLNGTLGLRSVRRFFLCSVVAIVTAIVSTPTAFGAPAAAAKPTATATSATNFKKNPSAQAARTPSMPAQKEPKPTSGQNGANANLPKSSSLTKAPVLATKSKLSGKIETSWSVSKVLAGWETFGTTDWPVSGEAVSAVAKGKNLDVHRGPGSDQPGLRFSEGRAFSGKVTLLVTRRYLDWIQVAIPVRPNGTVGWVRFDDVNLFSVPFRVVVDKSTNIMTIEQNGAESFRRSVAIGTGDTPTPTGLFFIREVIRTDGKGPYGPYVLGLSGYSDVLQTFAGGEGAIGIHGTNQPGLIGTNASFGCVRVTNDVMETIVRMLPLGTPVEITDSITSLPTQRRSYGIPDLVYETTPEPTEATPEDPVSILDAPDYNAAGIDFNEVDRGSRNLRTAATSTPASPPA